LHLLSNQPRTRLHSQHDAASTSRNDKVNGRERLALNPQDAAARGLQDGDPVRVFNARGAFVASAFIVDYLRPGVVQIATGAWYDPLDPGVPGSLEKHGNPNVVTMDSGTSRLTRAPAAQTVLVEVECCPDPPPVTAFELPRFAELSSV
jgi:biotin/methionine sulfoxide reductase